VLVGLSLGAVSFDEGRRTARRPIFANNGLVGLLRVVFSNISAAQLQWNVRSTFGSTRAGFKCTPVHSPDRLRGGFRHEDSAFAGALNQRDDVLMNLSSL
jgi:hypothetical protein